MALTGVRVGIDIGGTFTDFQILDERTGTRRQRQDTHHPARPLGLACSNGLHRSRRRATGSPSLT